MMSVSQVGCINLCKQALQFVLYRAFRYSPDFLSLAIFSGEIKSRSFTGYLINQGINIFVLRIGETDRA